MKPKMRTIALSVIASTMALSLAACGSDNKGETAGDSSNKNNSGGKSNVTLELAISKSSQDSPFIADWLLKEFETETGIKINLQLIPAEQSTTVLQTKLAVNEVPDLIQYNLASAVTDLNLERNFEILDNEPWVDRILNADVLSAYGNIYSFHVSQDTGMQGVVYNKDIFEELNLEIPTNYEEFLAVSEAIKASGITPVFMPYKDAWAANIWPAAAFADYAAKNDPTLFDDINANKKNWTDIPELEGILDQQYQIFKLGYTNADVLSDSYDMAVGKFLNKEVAMMFMGDWLIQNIESQDPEMNLGLFAIPYGEDPTIGASPLGGQLFIPKNSKHIAEAKQYLAFIASPEIAQKIVDEERYVSNLSDVTTPEQPAYKQEIIDNYITPKKVTLTMDAHTVVDQNEWYRNLQDHFTGSITPKEVLENWDVKFKDLMKAKGVEGF
ncbi:ABC transporter substrate-binding protein [Paenibacillus sp. FSL W7-1287]|uniref:ABC transporter substrate-binding protein n=1 Tax=Paenibacillus sp. FSL W7-1287 TaxID=2954538 RepID=UPI0030F7576B